MKDRNQLILIPHDGEDTLITANFDYIGKKVYLNHVWYDEVDIMCLLDSSVEEKIIKDIREKCKGDG